MIPNGPGACHRVPSTTTGPSVSHLNRPTATTTHLRTIWIFTKILTKRSRAGQGGHLIYFAQTPNNGTITIGSQGTCDAAQMSGSQLSSGTFLRSRIGNCQ
jgi:hypothetical protein